VGARDRLRAWRSRRAAARAAHRAAAGRRVPGIGYVVEAVHEAGKLQTIPVSTQNVTGASTAQVRRVKDASFKVGDHTAMSPVQIAEMFRVMSRQSQGVMRFDDMLGLLLHAAKMQVVLGAARGFTPHQTIDSTMTLTHLFRQYDAKGMPG
jgi:hypothetical protein